MPIKNATDYSFAPFHACNKLVTALRARKYQQSPTLPAATLKSKKASAVSTAGSEPEDGYPLVILAFDEAHTLTDREGDREDAWSNFNELRYVLRALHRFPLFSLFLSTTGKISQFTSAEDEDVSRRVTRGQLALIQPFTDLGFDTFANSVSLEDYWYLENVTTGSHIAHLGRPLYVLFICLVFALCYADIILHQDLGLVMMLARELSEKTLSCLQPGSSSTLILLRQSSHTSRRLPAFLNDCLSNSIRPRILLRPR